MISESTIIDLRYMDSIVTSAKRIKDDDDLWIQTVINKNLTENSNPKDIIKFIVKNHLSLLPWLEIVVDRKFPEYKNIIVKLLPLL